MVHFFTGNGFQQGSRGRYWIALLLAAIIGISTHGSASLSDTWQPSDIRSWVEIETPPGWSVTPGKNESESPDSAWITAYSGDKRTRLNFFLEHNQNEMTIHEITAYQNEQMSSRGFRICMTKEPVISSVENSTSYRQTYVRGSGDAAVIGTFLYPGWGQAHYTLIMEGSSAVAEYYEDIPPHMQEHIRPVFENQRE